MRGLLIALALLAFPASALADEASEYASQAHVSTAQAKNNLAAQAEHPNPVAEFGRNVWFDAASGTFRTDHHPGNRAHVQAVAAFGEVGGGSKVSEPKEGVFCTLSYFAHLPAGAYYYLTAGHCTVGGGVWKSGNCESRSTLSVVEPAADAGGIALAGASCYTSAAWVHTWGNPWEREKPYHFPEWKPFKFGPNGEMIPWIEVGPEEEWVEHPAAAPYVGEFVCKYGATVAHSCGLVEETNRTIEIGYGAPIGTVKVQHTYKVCTAAKAGDSGGPIDQRLMNTWGEWHGSGTGYTIARETANENCNTWGFELPNALARLGLELP